MTRYAAAFPPEAIQHAHDFAPKISLIVAIIVLVPLLKDRRGAETSLEWRYALNGYQSQ